MNALLLAEAMDRLEANRFRIDRHRHVPPTTADFASANLPSQRPKRLGGTMCLGIPGKVVEIYREHDLLMGKVDFGGVRKSVCLETVPEIAAGDYALVHVGFAIARIDENEARRVFAMLEEMGELDELKD